MRTEKNIKKCIIIIIIIIVFSVLIIYNCINNHNFWETSITDIITLIIAIFLSYFFTEKNSNIRKKKEVIETIIEKLQLKLESDIMRNINNQEDIKIVSINKRSIDNNLNLLKDSTKNLNVDKDISYIVEQFSNYISIIDNHINDIQYLKNSKIDFERYFIAMNDRLNKLRIDLY